jgi:para-nitrobenzyl esterase
MIKNLILLLVPACFFSCKQAESSQSPSVNITNGKVSCTTIASGPIEGLVTDDDVVRVFMGIPFAAPPVGDLRWKAPQPVEPWENIRKCATPPASAMQAHPRPLLCYTSEFLIPAEPVSEDCLYLNVWTAAKNPDEKRPVIVWIHGGAFVGGSGTIPLYDGEAMARKGVVFVTVNYRLGIFGFLAGSELTAESPLHTSGNYGILDQIAALEWIKENIAAFGGDADNVTIAGQSAGAISVCALIASPLAKNLFHQAIAESGALAQEMLACLLKDAEKDGDKVIKENGGSLAQMRQIPATGLLKIKCNINLVLDNVVINEPIEAYEKGQINDVPLLTGWNKDDIGGFDKLVINLTTLHATNSKNPVYCYYFTHVPPGNTFWGAFHSAEFGYALHTLKYWNNRPFTDVDYKLEEAMSNYWVNFAENGNPNNDRLHEWKTFNTGNPEIIEFGDEIKTISLPFKNR